MAAANVFCARSKDARKWKKKSSKVVEAEMCNKVEARHLVLITRILSREKAHSAFCVEKEKRAVKSAMQVMKDTSGVSELGEAPSGPDDSDYRDSPYFLNCVGVISEKRLQKWRTTADQIARELKADAESSLLEPPWRTNPYENIEQSFQQLLDGLGYDEEAELVKYLKRREGRSFVTRPRRKASDAAPRLRPRCDVFACLRNSSAIGDRLSGDTASRERGFSVRKWERAASKDYIAHVTGKVSSGTDWRKSSSLATGLNLSANSTSDVRYAFKDSDNTDEVPSGKVGDSYHAAVTPFTDARGDSGSNATPTRNSTKPRSSWAHRLITAPNTTTAATERCTDTTMTSVAGTKSFDARIGAKGSTSSVYEGTTKDCYSMHARVNTRITHRKPLERTGNKSKVGNGRPRTAPHGVRGRGDAETRQSRSATARPTRNTESTLGQAGNGTWNNRRGCRTKRTCAPIEINATHRTQTKPPSPPSTTTRMTITQPPPPPIKTTTSTSELNSGVHCVRSGAVSMATRSDISNWVSETIPEVSTPSTSDNGSSHRKTFSLSMSSSNSSSSSSSPRDSSRPDSNVPSKSRSLKPSLDNRPDIQGARVNQQIQRSNPESPRSIPDSCSPSMNTVLFGRSQGDATRRLPQWKRDLMLEAPPGVFSSREPVKVSVVMSKSQRQRELDQLVEENLSDVRTLVMRERARKMRARMNVFITIGTIEHVVNALKETVKRE